MVPYYNMNNSTCVTNTSADTTWSDTDTSTNIDRRYSYSTPTQEVQEFVPMKETQNKKFNRNFIAKQINKPSIIPVRQVRLTIRNSI